MDDEVDRENLGSTVNARDKPAERHTCQQIPAFWLRQDADPVFVLELLRHSEEAIDETGDLRLPKVPSRRDQSCSRSARYSSRSGFDRGARDDMLRRSGESD